MSVASVRETVRKCARAIGRDGSLYGAHSLRIGGATALAFLSADEQAIKDIGRWKSDAYLRYIRECKGDYDRLIAGICGADVDDVEADYLDLDAATLSDSDFE